MIVPLWILIAVSGYLLMALSQLTDKALLKVAFKESKSYVFLVGLMNILALVLLPFGVSILPLHLLLTALLAGAAFIIALLPFLSALQGDDATRVIPLVGGIIPIGTLIGETVFLHGSLGTYDLLAFAFLVIGSIILTVSRSASLSTRRSGLSAAKAVLGAILFAVSFVLTKYVFGQTDFINGFFWMRMGGVLVSAGLLLNSDVRRGLRSFFADNGTSIKMGYLLNQGVNGSGFVLQNIAISLASVSLVNALQGVQYLFVILLVAIASKFHPDLLGEKITKGIIIEKLTAIAVIITGILLLAL